MHISLRVSALALAVAALAPPAPVLAQNPDQQHAAHHSSYSMPADSGQCPQGMMNDMPGMMDAESGRMSPRVEERISTLKSDLKIAEEQIPQWNQFADALRGAAKSVDLMRLNMRKTGPLTDRLVHQERMLTGQLAAAKVLSGAFENLYAVLDAGQRRAVDALPLDHMGMM